MRCDRVREILMDYLAEELPEKTSMQVREHLEVCQPCRTELETAHKASGLLTLLGHQEEPQGTIRVPVVTAKGNAPWQRRVQLQLVGAVLLVMAICILRGAVLRSAKPMTTVARVEQADTRIKSAAPVLPHAPGQRSIVMDDGTVPHPSAHASESRARRQHKPHTGHSDHVPTNRPDKPAIAGSDAKPVQVVAEISPSSLLPTDEQPEGAILMVSVSRPSRSEVTGDSYSYRYTERDPNSGASIECYGSRNGESVEIRVHGMSDGKEERGNIANEATVEVNRTVLVCIACDTDAVCCGSQHR